MSPVARDIESTFSNPLTMVILVSRIPDAAHDQNEQERDHELDHKRASDVQARLVHAKSLRVHNELIDNRQSHQPVGQHRSHALSNYINNRRLERLAISEIAIAKKHIHHSPGCR
jgi:hypothetical protein